MRMLRLPLRSISGILTAACALSGVLGVACGDASVTSAQNWQNASPVETNTSTSTTEDAGAPSPSGDDSQGDDAAATAADADVGDGDAVDAGSDAGFGADSLTVTSTSATSTMDLMTTAVIPVSVASTGYKGMANLAVTGLPTGVTGAFDSSTVDLSSGTATAKLTLTSASSAAVQANNYTITATPVGGTTPSTLAASITLNPKLTVHLPLNLESTIATSKFNGGQPFVITGPANLSKTNPISVVMHNDDTSDYFEIHVDGSGTAGFAHGVQAIAPQSDEAFGTSNPRVINAKATVNFYMHGFGSTASMATGGTGGGSTDFPGTITVN